MAALAQAVSKGRRAEFAEHGWGDEVPDPQAASTMADSVLRWEERDEPVHAALLAWYRELIRLRRAVSDLRDPSLTSGRAERDGDLLTVHRGAHRVVANLGTEPTRVESGLHIVAAFEASMDAGGAVVVEPDGVVVLGPRSDHERI